MRYPTRERACWCLSEPRYVYERGMLTPKSCQQEFCVFVAYLKRDTNQWLRDIRYDGQNCLTTGGDEPMTVDKGAKSFTVAWPLAVEPSRTSCRRLI
jgi:hypothetical protein